MALDTKAHLLRIARGFFPIIVFFATLIAGIRLGAFDTLFEPVTSPLVAIFGLGLPLFPGGTYVIFQGFLNGVLAEKSKSWPTVNGQVIESDAAPTFIGLYIWLWWWPLIRFRYIVNGQLYEKNSWQFGRSNFGSLRRAKMIANQFPVGTKVHVHFDPDDPEIAVFDSGDGAARRGIWVGASLFAAPFALCLPVVWWNN
jgi:Protein of unknown function (DUF3592)